MNKPTNRMKLAYLKSFYTRDYHAIRAIRKFILDGEAKVLEWKWLGTLGDYRNKYENTQGEKMRDKHWRTFNDLLSAEIKIEGKKVVAEIQCSEGSLFDGEWRSERWRAKVELKAKHLSKFSAKIDFEIKKLAHEMFEREEQLRKENRIAELEEQILQEAKTC